MGNRTKVFQDSISLRNMTNPDKLKLVNYNRKIAMQYQNFLSAKFW